MPNKNLRILATVALLATSFASRAQLPWSDATHQIAFGDFNGDGKTDLLYVARDRAKAAESRCRTTRGRS